MNSLKTVALAILSLVITPSVFSQKAPIKFGKIDEKDLKMTVYEKDSSASAVILCDFGDTYMEYNTVKNDFEITYIRHVRVKVFKADQAVSEAFANIEIPYREYSYNNEDIVGEIKASVYYMENGVLKDTKMEKSSIFDEKVYNNSFIKKFAIPNVKDGVILEYTYTIKSDFYMSPRTWYFQSTFPTIWSEYRFVYDNSFYYALNQEGYNRLSINQNEAGGNYRWVMENVPALRKEEFMTTPKDYFDKIEFQFKSYQSRSGRVIVSNDNWNKFSKDLLEESEIGGKLKRTGATENIVKSLISSIKDDKEKVKTITEYVKNNFNVKTQGYIFTDKSHKKLLEEKVGSVGDVNLLLGAMLTEAGIKVKPILLSTRSNGRVAQNYPLMSRFNYLIIQAQIDTNYVLLDAAEPLLPVGTLPYEVLNGQGLLLDTDNPRWVDLQATKTVELLNVDVTIEEGKTLKGIAYSTMKSYQGLKNRKKAIKEGEDKQSKAFLGKLIANGTMKSYQYENLKNPYESLKGKFEFETTDGLDVNAEHIYINPLLTFGYTVNPFKKAERLYPVDFAHPFDELYNFTLKIPAGYIVEELPKSSKIAWQDGSVVFQYLVVPADANGIIKINSKIQVKKPVFTADEYADLKKTFEQIIAKHGEQIVLKKQAK